LLDARTEPRKQFFSSHHTTLACRPKNQDTLHWHLASWNPKILHDANEFIAPIDMGYLKVHGTINICTST